MDLVEQTPTEPRPAFDLATSAVEVRLQQPIRPSDGPTVRKAADLVMKLSD